MELGPQNHNGDGRLGPNSIIVVYMDPLGKEELISSDDESEPEQSSKRATVAKAVEVLLSAHVWTTPSPKPYTLNPKP